MAAVAAGRRPTGSRVRKGSSGPSRPRRDRKASGGRSGPAPRHHRRAAHGSVPSASQPLHRPQLHLEPGPLQLGEHLTQREGAVVHDEARAATPAFRTRITVSKPSSVQYAGEPKCGGAPTGKAKMPPGRSAACTCANSPGRSFGRKWPNAPKLTARSKAGRNGRARTSARTQCRRPSGSGRSPAPCSSMPALKSTPTTRSAHRCRRAPGSGSRAAADVEPGAERPEGRSSTHGRRGSGPVCGTESGRTSARAGRSHVRRDESAWTASSRRVGPWEVNIVSQGMPTRYEPGQIFGSPNISTAFRTFSVRPPARSPNRPPRRSAAVSAAAAGSPASPLTTMASIAASSSSAIPRSANSAGYPASSRRSRETAARSSVTLGSSPLRVTRVCPTLRNKALPLAHRRAARSTTRRTWSSARGSRAS